jgi:amidase
MSPTSSYAETARTHPGNSDPVCCNLRSLPALEDIVVKLTRRQAAKPLSLALAASLSIAALALGASRAQADPPPPLTTTPHFLAPYYSKGDVTGDGQLTRADLDVLTPKIGTTSGDLDWSGVSAADYDGDNAITLTDVADMARRMLYDDGPFKLMEASAVDMQKAMNAGVVTSVQITQAYLDRIAAYDHLTDSTHARALNSILATNAPAALAAAADSDAARAANGGPRSMVDGIPILLKDNYDTKDMPTTGGCGCWDGNQTSDDAFMVKGLRSQGAIILGKASMDEFAFGFVSEYSTGLPAGTSALVASPYRLASTAGGSSGGTGASISANLGAIGFGTDTGGSIRVPSSYNQLVGIRPTVGLTSRDGIIPLALSQDTGGPLAKSVTDAAIALDAVTGIDPNDPVTANQAGKVPASYTSYLDPNALQGKRIGYFTSMVSTAVPTRLFNQAVAKLTELGATVVPITATPIINTTLNEGSGSNNEMKHDLDIYIANHLAPSVVANSLQGIIDSGKYVPSRLSTYNTRKAITPAQYSTWMGTHTSVLSNGRAAVTSVMDTNNVDAMIYPTAGPYTTIGTNLRLSPNTGLPAVTVPMGQTITSDNSNLGTGVGVNLEFLGRAYDEGKLIGLTYDYEQATHWRTSPALYPALAPPAPATTPASVEAAPADVVTYTVTAIPSAVKIGDTVQVTVSDTGAGDLYAYDLDLGYDPSKLTYVSSSASTAISGATYVEPGSAGDLHVIHTKLGTSPATNGQADLVTLTFKAKGAADTAVTLDKITTTTSALATTSETPGASAPVSVSLLDAPVATALPVVEGDSVPGHTMTAVPGTWNLPGLTLADQWLLDGLPIAGATGPTYKVRKVDVGHKLSLLQTASLADHADGTATSKSVNVTVYGIVQVVAPLSAKVNAKPTLGLFLTALFGPKVLGSVDVYYGGVLIKDELPYTKAVTFQLPAKATIGSYPLRIEFHPSPGSASGEATFTFKVVK